MRSLDRAGVLRMRREKFSAIGRTIAMIEGVGRLARSRAMDMILPQYCPDRALEHRPCRIEMTARKTRAKDAETAHLHLNFAANLEKIYHSFMAPVVNL